MRVVGGLDCSHRSVVDRFPRRPIIEDRRAACGISRLSARRVEVFSSPNRASDDPLQAESPQLDPAVADTPIAQAEQAEAEGLQLAERLRQQGMSRARTIIANAEREAQAVLRSAKEAATVAEEHARARAAAIMEGRDAPSDLDPMITAWQLGGTATKISVMPPDGAKLRYRIAGPMGFGALLRLKKDISEFSGVSAVDISPVENGEAILSLQAEDSADVWQRLQSVPSLAGVEE